MLQARPNKTAASSRSPVSPRRPQPGTAARLLHGVRRKKTGGENPRALPRAAGLPAFRSTRNASTGHQAPAPVERVDAVAGLGRPFPDHQRATCALGQDGSQHRRSAFQRLRAGDSVGPIKLEPGRPKRTACPSPAQRHSTHAVAAEVADRGGNRLLVPRRRPARAAANSWRFVGPILRTVL